ELYHDNVESLRFYKQQQWKVTNYALLIYGVILFLQRAAVPTPLLIALAFFTWLTNIFVLGHLEKSIMRVRWRIDLLHGRYFTPYEVSEFDLETSSKRRWYDEASSKRRWDDPFDKQLIHFLLAVASTVGLVTVFWLVWYHPTSSHRDFTGPFPDLTKVRH